MRELHRKSYDAAKKTPSRKACKVISPLQGGSCVGSGSRLSVYISKCWSIVSLTLIYPWVHQTLVNCSSVGRCFIACSSPWVLSPTLQTEQPPHPQCPVPVLPRPGWCSELCMSPTRPCCVHFWRLDSLQLHNMSLNFVPFENFLLYFFKFTHTLKLWDWHKIYTDIYCDCDRDTWLLGGRSC